MSNILPLAVTYGESGPRRTYVRGVARISGTDVVRISGTRKAARSAKAPNPTIGPMQRGS